ncbi:MAG: response regulator [Ktedonobacteraceae bacterium]|nr:response regulator [Ktedonobacteraceae bacterium]
MTYNNDTANKPVNGTMSLSGEIATHEAFTNVQSSDKPQEETTIRILVVEDDTTLARLEAGILSAHGYTVAAVHSGELAIATLRHSIPDLVVLDLELTGNVQGWDVLQALRDFASIPVLLTTSSTTAVRASIRLRGESRSTLDHLPKPYPMQTLLKRVERMLTAAPQ